MNTNSFLMSLIVVGLAALGGYGLAVRAAPPAEIIATAAEQPVEAPGEATEEMREAEEAAGFMDDTVTTTKVKAALLQDPGTAAPAIGVETLIGGVQLSESVDNVDEKQVKEIAERVDGVIAVDNALSWTMRYP